MHDSLNVLEMRARKLVMDHYEWLEQNTKGRSAPLNTNTPTTAGELANLSTRVEGFARMAREITESPAFADPLMDPVLKNDIIEIAEESEEGYAEITRSVMPDEIWKDLDHGKKTHLTHSHIMEPEKLDRFKARLKGDLRKQKKITAPEPEAQGLAADASATASADVTERSPNGTPLKITGKKE